MAERVVFVKQYSLRRRITLICVIPFLIFGIIIAALYRFYQQTNVERSKSLTMSLAKSYGERVSENLSAINTAALNASSNSDVQSYLLAMSDLQKLGAYPVLTHSLNLIAESTAGCRCVFVRSENLSLLRSTSDFFAYYSMLMNDYGMWSSSPPRASFFAGPYRTSGNATDLFCYVYTRMAEYDLRVKAGEGAYDIVTIILFDPMSLLRTGMDNPNIIEGLVFNDTLISSGELPDDVAGRISGKSDDNIAEVSFQGGAYYLSRMTLQGYPGFDYFCLISTDDVTGDLSGIRMLTSAVLIGNAFLILILLFLTRRWVSKPITLLVENLKAVTPETTDVAQTDLAEFNGVVGAVRSILISLQESRRGALDAQRNAYEAELSRMSAEMKSYRSQINPHFLFNTLGCISAMARDYEAATLEKSCMALAEMCRYALKAPVYVPLERDIANTSNYMQIMDARMPGRFDFRVRASAEALGLHVLSLTLQPLVENCVEHGFRQRKKRTRCVIDLLAQAQDGMLCIRLTDNGSGMSDETVSGVRRDMLAALSYQNDHIGLNNLWHRLRLAYGEDCRIDFKSMEGFYTQVSVVIPLSSISLRSSSGDSFPATDGRRA